MIEDILENFKNIQELPTQEEIKVSFSDDIFNEKILTEVEFKLTKLLDEKYPTALDFHWEKLKQRWRNRWC